MITIESKSITAAIEKIRKENSKISGDVLNKAMSRTLNRSAQQARTEANRNIRQKYNISASRVNKEFTIRNSNDKTLTAILTAKGSPMSLTQFQAKQVGERGTTSFDRKGVASSRLNRKSRSKAVKGVSAVIRKGQTINLPFAFIQAANGGLTVFARGAYNGDFKPGKERLPIAKMTTAAIPLMFGASEVMKPTLNYSEKIFSDRFEHELTQLLR